MDLDKELIERADDDGTPVYYHALNCPSFCDYECNGNTGALIAKLVTETERLEAENEKLEKSQYTPLWAVVNELKLGGNGCPDSLILEHVSKLREALEESVKLQSHYAGLLNMYDDGKRIQFGSAQVWLDRLEALKGDSG